MLLGVDQMEAGGCDHLLNVCREIAQMNSNFRRRPSASAAVRGVTRDAACLTTHLQAALPLGCPIRAAVPALLRISLQNHSHDRARSRTGSQLLRTQAP
jgi:hypothetical protein